MITEAGLGALGLFVLDDKDTVPIDEALLALPTSEVMPSIQYSLLTEDNVESIQVSMFELRERYLFEQIELSMHKLARPQQLSTNPSTFQHEARDQVQTF